MKKTFLNTLIIGLIIVICGLITIGNEPSAAKPKHKSVYQRVVDSGVLRCGYFIEPPFGMEDPNTGELSGLSIDLTRMIAEELNLKIEWVEQISFATFPQDLKNKRYDMVCGDIFILPRGGMIDYAQPYTYVSVHGYVRPDNTTFDKRFDDVNWSNTTIAGLDGEGATTAALKILPQAKMNILPQRSDISEMLLNVATGKSDIGFVLPSVYEDFNKANPEKLRPAKLDKPLYTYAVSFAIAPEEHAFKSLINNTLTKLIASGELDSLFNKYDPKGHFKRP